MGERNDRSFYQKPGERWREGRKSKKKEVMTTEKDDQEGRFSKPRPEKISKEKSHSYIKGSERNNGVELNMRRKGETRNRREG